MLITIGDKTRKAMEILGIKEYPFTEETLKSNFRAACLKSHPDTGGSAQAFHAVKESYEHLENLVINAGDSPKHEEPENLDIFKEGVWDDCPSCKGTKKILSERDQLSDCPTCKGSGETEVKCRPCNGSGRFVTRSGFNVKCKSCSGSGIFPKKVACPTCNSERIRTLRKTESFFMYARLFGSSLPPKGKIFIKQGIMIQCSNCAGLGKIRLNLFNAVIPKGAILR